MTDQLFTLHRMAADDIEPATHMRLQSWMETYKNDEVGVTRKWIEARNKLQLSPEKVALRRSWLDNPNVQGWVAKDKSGMIIGVATSYRDDAGIQHVGSLYTHKAWHGKGVGAALMQKIIDWSDPTKPIELGVVTYNGRAKAFYEKWGFREVPDSEILFDNKIPEVKMMRKGDQQ
jgi:GNAT superfamily N-acetyltransferase